jgi:hypothetical protein
MSHAADEWVNALHVGFTSEVFSDTDAGNVKQAVDALVRAFANHAPVLTTTTTTSTSSSDERVTSRKRPRPA